MSIDIIRTRCGQVFFFVIVAGLLQAGISRGRDIERGFQPGMLFFFALTRPYSFILRHRVL